MNKPRPTHTPITRFPVVDDCLRVGGIALTRLAQRVGRTPFYAYDRELISARVAELRSHLPQEVHLHYAVKANPDPVLLKLLATLGVNFDCASKVPLL